MKAWLWLVIAAAAGLLGVVVANVVRVLRHPRVARVTISDPDHSTTMDESGAVRSIQGADLVLPDAALAELWTPEKLERLARTYWRFLTRVTLGLIRVAYTDEERFVVLLTRPFVLLRFQAPEYEMDDKRGIVRWRIERGILVASRGRGGDGYLEIDIERHPSDEPGHARLHVTVEVANFYPMIASTFSKPAYKLTQSFVHVLVTHAFLRSLARLDLARSRAGRLADISELPDPDPETAASEAVSRSGRR